MHFILFRTVAFAWFPMMVGAQLDNELMGVPSIQCNSETIEMTFRTKKKFTGKVFVKGHYNKPECRVDYSQTNENGVPIGGIKLSHGQCDMDRQRILSPEGIQFGAVLVISFHPLFITSIDKVFHVQCLYREAVRTVTSGITVSSIPAYEMLNDFPTPLCSYTIRKDEIDGPILSYARVGDQIVHKWECNTDMYGLLVHSCYVEDGQGEKQRVIDDRGCHIDRNLLGDPTYIEALNMAYRDSLVFKFADRVVVRFQCEIRLCLKENGGCDGITPPMCDGSIHVESRGKSPTAAHNSTSSYHRIQRTHDESSSNISNTTKNRSLRSLKANNSRTPRSTVDSDLISQRVYVLDTDDTLSDASLSSINSLSSARKTGLCIDKKLLIFLSTLVSVVVITLGSISIWLVGRLHRRSLVLPIMENIKNSELSAKSTYGYMH